MKRATAEWLYSALCNVDFNPRPREEGDPWNMVLSPRSRDFNPRPREEGDTAVASQGQYGTGISIHALVKRATLLKYCLNRGKWISIHALVKRATLTDTTTYNNTMISIHALVKRATYLLCKYIRGQNEFQSTPS